MHDIGNGHVNYSQLLHQTYSEALMRNELAQNHWQKLKEEYKTLESFLIDLPKELSKDVMVPVAPRALMRGQITHSNEILVCLGQGYFVKRSAIQAAEICKRREKICSDMLESLEREKNLFVGRQELPVQQGAFAGEREIIEEYNEEEETRWKAEHKKKEREYRQKLAELRAKEKTEVVDEESLWQRLDELELQEELEEELDRLYAEESDEEEEEEEEDEEDEDDEEEGNDLDIRKEGLQSEENLPKEEMPTKCPSLVRRVSFAALAGDENEDEELRIEFHHCNVAPSVSSGSGIIQSPAELYLHFKNVFLAEPKSILKKTSSYDNSFENPSGEENSPGEVTEYKSAIDLPSSPMPPPPPPVREEVIERVTNVSSATPAADRPVSRFKALRQQKRR